MFGVRRAQQGRAGGRRTGGSKRRWIRASWAQLGELRACGKIEERQGGGVVRLFLVWASNALLVGPLTLRFGRRLNSRGWLVKMISFHSLPGCGLACNTDLIAHNRYY